MTAFTQLMLCTDAGGRAKFRTQSIPLTEGSQDLRLSAILPSSGVQLRESPIGYRSKVHCTEVPQWIFILKGSMEVSVAGGNSLVFGPGDHFYANDTLPAGAVFDPAIHGHWSRQVGDAALVTLFVKA